MVQIRKGHTILTVTRGAYNNYYKHLGYEPVAVAKSNENPGCDVTQPDGDSHHLGDPTQQESGEETPYEEEDTVTDEEAENEESELSEIPLSEMGSSQLHEYAEQLGLDHEGIRKKSELRALIREHLS